MQEYLTRKLFERSKQLDNQTFRIEFINEWKGAERNQQHTNIGIPASAVRSAPTQSLRNSAEEQELAENPEKNK